MADDYSLFMVEFWEQIFIIKALALVWLRFTNRKSLERRRRMKNSRISGTKTARHLSELEISNCPNDIRPPGHSFVTASK